MNLGNTALKCKITSLLGQKGFHFHHSSHLQVDRVTVTGMLIGNRNEFTSEHMSRELRQHRLQVLRINLHEYIPLFYMD